MKELVFVALFFVTLFGSAQVAYEKKLFLDSKDTLRYKLLRPGSKFAGQKVPLIIFFHGAGERGSDNESQTIHIDKLVRDSSVRADFGFFLIAPQCPADKKWSNLDWKKKKHVQPADPSWAMKLVHKLVDSLKKVLDIDTTRIYVTGMSMGGYGTWDYCARYPKEVAAAVPVCGGYDFDTAKKIKNISFWVFHGAQDKVVPVENSRGMVNGLKKAKANVKYTELAGVGHGAWLEAYKDTSILKWMFSFSTSGTK
jgi:predicted peptidase